MKIGKLLKAFGNMDKIYEGIRNNVFRKDHIEAVASVRWQTCKVCEMLDETGKDCAVPGTQPCCSDCGCAIGNKIRCLSCSCPLDKWKEVMTEEAEELLLEKLEDE